MRLATGRETQLFSAGHHYESWQHQAVILFCLCSCASYSPPDDSSQIACHCTANGAFLLLWARTVLRQVLCISMCLVTFQDVSQRTLCDTIEQLAQGVPVLAPTE